jgi:hypothetical protein
VRIGLLRFSAFLAVLVAQAVVPRASAQGPSRVGLDYQRGDGAASCPDGTALQVGVSGRLGYDPFDDHASRRLKVSIGQVGHGLEARVEMSDATGAVIAERRLVSRQRDCKELASSVELAIAIAVDPTGRPPVVAPAASTEEAPKTSPPDAPPPPSPQVSHPLAGDLKAMLVAGWRSAPSASLGISLGGDLRGEVWSLGIDVRADLPSSEPLRTGHVKTSLFTGSLVPCLGSAHLAFCALATVGLLHGSADGLERERDANFFFAAVGARAALAYPIDHRWSVALHADAVSPLTEIDLTVDGKSVWSTSTLVYSVALGATAKIP